MGRVLIITGMHRSGTSLVASYLQRAGLFIGEELLGPDVGNPKGYFEDARLHDVHLEIMRRHGIADGFTVSDENVPLRFVDADFALAERAVANARDLPQWGWKEPRSALFCDLWSRVLPDASYLFLVRPPLAVLDSLMRRAANESVRDEPVRGLEIWRLHNAEMLRFTTQHPDRCVWWNADGFVGDPARLVDMLVSRFALDLVAPSFEEIFDADAFHHDVRGRARLVATRNRAETKRCKELYAEIEALTQASIAK